MNKKVKEGQDVEKPEDPHSANGNVKWHNHFGAVRQFFKEVKRKVTP